MVCVVWCQVSDEAYKVSSRPVNCEASRVFVEVDGGQVCSLEDLYDLVKAERNLLAK